MSSSINTSATDSSMPINFYSPPSSTYQHFPAFSSQNQSTSYSPATSSLSSSSSPINYYSPHSSSIYSPFSSYTSHYNNSTPMWPPAYQPTQSSSSLSSSSCDLNGSYFPDSAYYSSYNYTNSSAAPHTNYQHDSSSKKRAVEATTSTTSTEPSNDEDNSKKRPRIEKVEYYALSAKEESTCKTCGARFDCVSKCLMHVHVLHNLRDPNECPICCEYIYLVKNKTPH